MNDVGDADENNFVNRENLAFYEDELKRVNERVSALKVVLTPFWAERRAILEAIVKSHRHDDYWKFDEEKKREVRVFGITGYDPENKSVRMKRYSRFKEICEEYSEADAEHHQCQKRQRELQALIYKVLKPAKMERPPRSAKKPSKPKQLKLPL